MIKANLKKNIIEVAGNDMDHLSELMALTWELKERYPELRGLMKESFDTVMNAKERPIFESEEKFTRDMRELFGATNEPEESVSLDEEDIEYILLKIAALKNTGKEASCDFYSNGNVTVWIWRKDSKEKRYIDKSFDFYLYEKGRVAETSREVYNECIKHLEQLAGEEDDN